MITNTNLDTSSNPISRIEKCGSYLSSICSQTITFDNLARVTIAASIAIGGTVIAQANSQQEMLDGASIAGAGSAISCLLWGVACALKGETHKAANRLGLATLLGGIGIAAISKSSAPMINTLDTCARVHTCSISEIALPFLDHSKSICDRTGINPTNLPKLEILERPLGIADQQLLQHLSDKQLRDIKAAYNHPMMDEVVSLINVGQLPLLLEKFSSIGNKLSNIILAARVQGDKNLSLDDLATAMISHRIYYQAKRPMRIWSINENYNNAANHTAVEVQSSNETALIPTEDLSRKFSKSKYSAARWKRLIQAANPNQRIIISTEQNTKDMQNVFVIGYSSESMLSFKLVNAIFIDLFGRFLTPVVGMSKAEDLPSMLASSQWPFGLFYPESIVLIHGKEEAGVGEFEHDLAHAFLHGYEYSHSERIPNIHIARTILKHLESEPSLYKTKTAYNEKDIRFFIQTPTPEELIQFVLRKSVTIILDGFSSLPLWDDFATEEVRDVYQQGFGPNIPEEELVRMILDRVKHFQSCQYD